MREIKSPETIHRKCPRCKLVGYLEAGHHGDDVCYSNICMWNRAKAKSAQIALAQEALAQVGRQVA